ncbi:MAG: 3-oxoadipate enol-lactonase [Pseudomonadota bacterium]
MPLIRANETDIEYQIDGPVGAPVLVLINSIATDMHVWTHVMPTLVTRFRVLRYDARGQGRSAAPGGEYTLGLMAGDLLALLDALDIERAQLCGVSLGAMVAMRVALDAPRRVERLILCNTAAYVGPPEAWNARAAAVQEQGMVPVREALLARWLSATFRDANPVQTTQLADAVQSSPAAGYIGACAAIRDMDLRHDIAAIAIPTLVVTSSDDLATPPAEGQYIASRISGARVIELAGGHLSNIEQPKRLADEIMRFAVA